MKGGKSNSVVDQIKKQIKEQIEVADEIQELSFSGINIGTFTAEQMAVFSKYNKLISLEFNNCQLKSLEGFKFQNIVKLCFEENQLDGAAVKYIADNFPEISFLSLSNNKIQSLEVYHFSQKDLQPLGRLNNLVQLDLQENPVSQVANYRESLFGLCKKLDILDNKDKEGNEVQYTDEEDEQEDADAAEQSDSDEDYTQDEEESEEEDDEDEEEEEPRPRKRRR